jgi:dienelactone hydrolase
MSMCSQQPHLSVSMQLKYINPLFCCRHSSYQWFQFSSSKHLWACAGSYRFGSHAAKLAWGRTLAFFNQTLRA